MRGFIPLVMMVAVVLGLGVFLALDSASAAPAAVNCANCVVPTAEVNVVAAGCSGFNEAPMAAGCSGAGDAARLRFTPFRNVREAWQGRVAARQRAAAGCSGFSAPRAVTAGCSGGW